MENNICYTRYENNTGVNNKDISFSVHGFQAEPRPYKS